MTSLSLENLQGAESIPRYITTRQREAYEFRVYQHLGELFIKQDRTKDAADTFSAFARRQPLHAQAPVLQARVIEIYQAGGFANSRSTPRSSTSSTTASAASSAAPTRRAGSRRSP